VISFCFTHPPVDYMACESRSYLKGLISFFPFRFHLFPAASRDRKIFFPIPEARFFWGLTFHVLVHTFFLFVFCPVFPSPIYPDLLFFSLKRRDNPPLVCSFARDHPLQYPPFRTRTSLEKMTRFSPLPGNFSFDWGCLSYWFRTSLWERFSPRDLSVRSTLPSVQADGVAFE